MIKFEAVLHAIFYSLCDFQMNWSIFSIYNKLSKSAIISLSDHAADLQSEPILLHRHSQVIASNSMIKFEALFHAICYNFCDFQMN